MQKNREWVNLHKDESLQHQKKYRECHREELRGYGRQRYKDNPEKFRLNDRRRRAREAGACGSHTIADINRLKVLQRSLCAVCKTKLKPGYHIDHIFPLALGGSNDANNLQLLCPTCNMKKNAKHPVDFMQEQGFLI